MQPPYIHCFCTKIFHKNCKHSSKQTVIASQKNIKYIVILSITNYDHLGNPLNSIFLVVKIQLSSFDFGTLTNLDLQEKNS